VVQHVAVGVFPQMANKTSVVSQLLHQQPLARNHGILNVDNNAYTAILNISTIVFVVGRVLAPDLPRNSVYHPSQRLSGTGNT
jgi:hypothetical protein